MTEEESKQWIKKYLKENPQVAQRYKEQLLKRYEIELRFAETAHKRGEIPGFLGIIASAKSKIEEIKNKDATEYFIEWFYINYWSECTEARDDADIFHSPGLTDEDCYINGVFKEAGIDYINNEIVYKIAKQYKSNQEIYAKGLENRDYYIEKGKEHFLESVEKVKEFDDLDKYGPEIIRKMYEENEKFYKKNFKDLARFSVVDAFSQMKVQTTPKHAEKIDKIIELHDPDAVLSALESLKANPTPNMINLAQNSHNAPGQDRKELRLMKAIDILEITTGVACTVLGITGALAGNPSWHNFAIGGFNLGLGATGLARHIRKTKHLASQEDLVLKVIDDLLNEVLIEESFDKSLEV